MDSSTGAGVDINNYRAMVDDGGPDADDIEAHRLRPTDHTAADNDGDGSSGADARGARRSGEDDGDGATLWSAHGGDRFQWPASTEYDAFFRAVYEYYEGKGFVTRLVSRILHLLTLGFVVGFATFLFGCVNWPLLLSTYDVSQSVSISQLANAPVFILISLVSYVLVWVWHFLYVLRDIKELGRLRHFYNDILEIPDRNLPTTRWTDVVTRIIEVQPEDDPARRLDHQDIANMILRRTNYMVAMFNQEVIRLNIPLPFGNGWEVPAIMTGALQWNLEQCLDFIFDKHGRVHRKFLKPENRDALASRLRWWFYFAAIANLVFMPFTFLLMLMQTTFRYGMEFQRNPQAVAARQYTLLAKWRLRELNEYPHNLERRLAASHTLASDYVGMYPSDTLAAIARFISFVAGAFAFVLTVISFVDEEALLKLELSPGRSVLWYIGIFTAIFAVSRSLVPVETQVFQPELLVRRIIDYTHYYPTTWRGKLHTYEVYSQFSELFQLRVKVLLLEILGIVFVPVTLALGAAPCSEAIVDFVCKCTVRDARVGEICTFAAFDVKRHGNQQYGSTPDARAAPEFVSRHGKLEKSLLNFRALNPGWTPREGAQAYLNRLAASNAEHPEQPAGAVAGAASGATPTGNGGGGVVSPRLVRSGFTETVGAANMPPSLDASVTASGTAPTTAGPGTGEAFLQSSGISVGSSVAEDETALVHAMHVLDRLFERSLLG